jgi:hypothetical protein
MARSVLPHSRRLLKLDQRLRHAAARPVIVPETIVCDHGKAFISQNFRSSCHIALSAEDYIELPPSLPGRSLKNLSPTRTTRDPRRRRAGFTTSGWIKIVMGLMRGGRRDEVGCRALG